MTNKLTIQLFDKTIHDRENFSCGVAAMDRWFKNSISEQIKNNRLRVYCAANSENALVGFYAINAHEIAPEGAPELARKGERFPIPAIYLNAIAVNIEHQGAGIGRALLGHAVLKCISISDELGVAAIVLDVHKDEEYEKRVRFYQAHGFQFFQNHDERMFLTIKDAVASK